MTKTPISAGMYAGESQQPSRFSLNDKTTKVKLDSGEYIEVINPEYVFQLEARILEMSKRLDIHINKSLSKDNEIRRLKAAIQKLDGRF